VTPFRLAISTSRPLELATSPSFADEAVGPEQLSPDPLLSIGGTESATGSWDGPARSATGLSATIATSARKR
jgi:hypothetical protein